MTMTNPKAPEKTTAHHKGGLLQTHELYEYILETNVYPREHEPLKELRGITASHASSIMGTAPDVGQMIGMLLKLLGAKKTIEIGVFTGYSLLLTALTIPDDGKIVAIDMDRKAYDEIGSPVLKKAGVEHKVEFMESEALPALDKMLHNAENKGSFDFAFVDADKINYINYHERIMKLVRINGIVAYDNTLWFGTVSQPESSVVDEFIKEGRMNIIEFNKSIAADPRIEILMVPLGDGITICRRLY